MLSQKDITAVISPPWSETKSGATCGTRSWGHFAPRNLVFLRLLPRFRCNFFRAHGQGIRVKVASGMLKDLPGRRAYLDEASRLRGAIIRKALWSRCFVQFVWNFARKREGGGTPCNPSSPLISEAARWHQIWEPDSWHVFGDSRISSSKIQIHMLSFAHTHMLWVNPAPLPKN